MHIPSIVVADMLAASRFDAIVIDLQHSEIDFAGAVGLIIAIEGRGVEPFVRLPAIDPALIGKLLDAGATGIIAPYVESGSDAEAPVSACRYPPRGRRSYGPRRPLLRYCADYAAIASDTIVTFAMIETVEGVREMTQILSTDGIDAVFIGPSDLSLSLAGTPMAWRTSREVVDTIECIRAEASSLNKKPGIFCHDIATAVARREEGFDLITAAPDLAMISTAATEAVAKLAGRSVV